MKDIERKLAEAMERYGGENKCREDLSYGKYCDHTVLRAYTQQAAVKEFCDEAKRYNAASVCVNPIHVAFVHEQLQGTGIHTCTVVGFPLGANKPSIKAAEAAEAIADGAEEVDMVMNVGALRDGNYELVLEDIRGVVEAAKGKACVKVIIETCYLSCDEKIKACVLCEHAGADYVKTSTGFGTGGATEEDVRLIKMVVGDRMKVKASTGIETREDADKMINAGAVRLGTSRIPQIVSGNKDAFSASKKNQPPEYE